MGRSRASFAKAGGRPVPLQLLPACEALECGSLLPLFRSPACWMEFVLLVESPASKLAARKAAASCRTPKLREGVITAKSNCRLVVPALSKRARELEFLWRKSGARASGALQMCFDVILETRCEFAADFPRSGILPVGLDASHASNLAGRGADEHFLRRVQICGSKVLLRKCVACRGNDLVEGLRGLFPAGSRRSRAA